MFPLPEKITVWNALTNDGFGGKSYDGPFVYDARIAFINEKFTDNNGDQLMSTAVVYSRGSELKIDSQVFFGESASAEPEQAANDTRRLSQTPSGAGTLKKGWFA